MPKLCTSRKTVAIAFLYILESGHSSLVPLTFRVVLSLHALFIPTLSKNVSEVIAGIKLMELFVIILVNVTKYNNSNVISRYTGHEK